MVVSVRFESCWAYYRRSRGCGRPAADSASLKTESARSRYPTFFIVRALTSRSRRVERVASRLQRSQRMRAFGTVLAVTWLACAACSERARSEDACEQDLDCRAASPDVCNICSAPENHLVCAKGQCACACQVQEPPDAGLASCGSNADCHASNPDVCNICPAPYDQLICRDQQCQCECSPP